jgi:hypothetical protein
MTIYSVDAAEREGGPTKPRDLAAGSLRMPRNIRSTGSRWQKLRLSDQTKRRMLLVLNVIFPSAGQGGGWDPLSGRPPGPARLYVREAPARPRDRKQPPIWEPATYLDVLQDAGAMLGYGFKQNAFLACTIIAGVVG